MCLCQYNLILAKRLSGWEGNNRCWLNGLGKGDEQPAYATLEGSSQWLNYSKVGGETLNAGVNVELVPVVKFSRNAD